MFEATEDSLLGDDPPEPEQSNKVFVGQTAGGLGSSLMRRLDIFCTVTSSE